ncbi:MAG: FmdB family zinc ribbon protein [Chthoniobacterales bacterium]
MPTYEYHCEKCGKNFDAYQSMKDDSFKTCPKEKCQMEEWGEGTVKRQIGTGAGLIFKGSGFYITDYRSENYKAGAKSDKSDGGKSGSSPAPAASESKPAPKAETPKPATPKPAAD